MGNLKSVSKAFEFVGAEVKVTSSPEDIHQADAVVLPGVGAFSRGMQNLKKLKLDKAIYEALREKKPFLGICLGLQLLFTQTEEHGIYPGLGIISGQVKRLPPAEKIPHMGWNQVKYQPASEGVSQIFQSIPDQSYFYFVHSYYVEPVEKEVIMTTTHYGREFVSSVSKDNLFAFQFHPEKSGPWGLQILRNFLKLC
jgi:glutamine amidotransferase